MGETDGPSINQDWENAPGRVVAKVVEMRLSAVE